DVEALHLLGEGLAHGLQRVLHGRVVAVTGDGQAAGDRGDVDDRPAPAAAHAGEHRLDHPDDAEVVRLEQALGPIDRDVLDAAAAADAGVVDQHVDPAGLVVDLVHAELHRGRVVHVEGDHPDRQVVAFNGLAELGRCGGVADGGPDLVPLPREVRGGGQP